MTAVQNRWPQLAVFTLAVLVGAGGWWMGSHEPARVQAKVPAHLEKQEKPVSGTNSSGLDLPEPPDILSALPELELASPPQAAGAIAPDDYVASRKAQAVLLAERADRKDDPLITAWEVTMRRAPVLSAQPLTPPDWTIMGVLQRGAQQEIIVQRGTDPKPYFHKVGDVLPGGARIAWVRPDAVGLILPKRQVVAVPLN